MYLLFKAILTGGVVVGISEIAKKSSLLAAILASLPLTSILAMVWIYFDSKNLAATKELSINIFWMVLPSLFFFLAFPVLVRLGLRFYPALFISSMATAGVYYLYVQLLGKLGISI